MCKVSLWHLFWHRLRLLGHSQSLGTLENLYLVLLGECKFFVLCFYFSLFQVHFLKWFLLKWCYACRLIISIAWVAHIIIYLLVDPPLSSFLNEVFIKLDGVWGIFWSFVFL
jgi:hypothetical protein